MLLPVLVVVVSIILCCNECLQPTISDYYYTRSGDILEGVLWVLAFFLFAYKGHEPLDNIITNFAGVCALGVAFFPTTYISGSPQCMHHEAYQCASIGMIHNISAILLFFTFGIMSRFIFIKTDKVKGHPNFEIKQKRNKVFKLCGILIFVFIGIILFYEFLRYKSLLPYSIETYLPLLILEILILWSFGISWLIKGQFMMKDVQRG